MSTDKKPPTEVDEWEDSEVRDVPPGIRPYDPTKATARRALAEINNLKKNFEKFEERQHDRDRVMIEKFDEHAREDRVLFSKLGDKIDSQNQVLSTIRIENAAQTVELKQVVHELKGQKQVAAIKEQLDLQVGAKKTEADIDDTTHQKKFRRDLLLKMVGILGPIFAAVGGAVALLLQKC